MPSFSESSLTVMPSEIVISRSMGGGAAGCFAGASASAALSLPAPASRCRAAARAALGWRTALLLGRWVAARPRHRRARSGMHRCADPSAWPPGRRCDRAAHAGTAHHGLAGTNGTAINRLAGNRACELRGRHAGTRRCGWPAGAPAAVAASRATRSGRGGTTGRAAGCPARFGRGRRRKGTCRRLDRASPRQRERPRRRRAGALDACEPMPAAAAPRIARSRRRGIGGRAALVQTAGQRLARSRQGSEPGPRRRATAAARGTGAGRGAADAAARLPAGDRGGLDGSGRAAAAVRPTERWREPDAAGVGSGRRSGGSRWSGGFGALRPAASRAAAARLRRGRASRGRRRASTPPRRPRSDLPASPAAVDGSSPLRNALAPNCTRSFSATSSSIELE